MCLNTVLDLILLHFPLQLISQQLATGDTADLDKFTASKVTHPRLLTMLSPLRKKFKKLSNMFTFLSLLTFPPSNYIFHLIFQRPSSMFSTWRTFILHCLDLQISLEFFNQTFTISSKVQQKYFRSLCLKLELTVYAILDYSLNT